MPEFDMKLVPKDKADLTKFKNFHNLNGCSFDQFNGQIVYLNAGNPDTHIYRPYYMSGGIAHPLFYGSIGDKKSPMLTLQELNYEDNIIFYTHADVERLEQQKKAKANKPTTP